MRCVASRSITWIGPMGAVSIRNVGWWSVPGRTRPAATLCVMKKQLTRFQSESRGLQSLFHRSEEHTSELQSLMRNSYAVFCLKKKKNKQTSSHMFNKYHEHRHKPY